MVTFIAWTIYEAIHGSLTVAEQLSMFDMICGELCGAAVMGMTWLVTDVVASLNKEKK